MGKRRVLFDTNAIIEAHRTGCWKTLKGHFLIETVEKCVQECLRGKKEKRGYIPVDSKTLRQDVSVKNISIKELAELSLKLSDGPDLDEGEKHLLAYALTQEEEWFICSPDNALIRAAVKICLRERLISLEKLADEAGIKSQLAEQYRRKWLETKRMEYINEYGIQKGCE